MAFNHFIEEYLAPLLALLFGLLSFKHFTFFWKLLFIQVLVYLIVIKVVYEITPGIQTNSNHWFYNSYLIVEIGFLCFAPLKLFKTTFEKTSIIILYGFYLSVFLLQIYLNGADHFANFAFATAGFIISLIYSYLLYVLFQKNTSNWLSSPIFWASLGILLFFACNVPYFSMFNFLNKNYLKLSQQIFLIITEVLANARYLLLALAFYFLRRNSRIEINKILPK